MCPKEETKILGENFWKLNGPRLLGEIFHFGHAHQRERDARRRQWCPRPNAGVGARPAAPRVVDRRLQNAGGGHAPDFATNTRDTLLVVVAMLVVMCLS